MGARLHFFDRRFDRGWQLDLDRIAAAITPRTRLIALTRPHNPSGAIVGVDDLLALGRLAGQVSAHVLVDEVYLDAARALRPTVPCPPAATLDGPFLSSSSLTKSYGLAGLRSGWVVAPTTTAEMLRRTRDVIDNASSGPADRLAALAFASLPALAERARALLTVNVALARDFFAAHPALRLAEPPASSVVFPRLAEEDDAAPFVSWLLAHHGVAVAPGSFFDAPAHFRISLAGRTEALARGLAAIGRALDERAAGDT
jgi:aspartate/methionine/tyrosine aminotransferase